MSDAWQIKVVEHGTHKLVAVPKFGSVRWERRLDEISTATATWLSTECPRIRKWEHELEVWLARTLVWAGPIITPQRRTNQQIGVSARDLGMRLERLFVARDRTYVQEDLGLIFGQLATDALDLWPTLGISVVTHPTGTLGDRQYVHANYERLADKLRELARTDVDYTFIGRQMIAGGSSIPGSPSWRLIDAMVAEVQDADDGLSQVNDAVVVGSKLSTAPSADPTPMGEYIDALSIAHVGPLQVRYSEPDIRDSGSAGVAAKNRVRFFGSALPDLRVQLKEGQYDVDDLVPGAAVRVDLTDASIPYGEQGDYLLLTVDGSLNEAGEASVTVGLVQAGDPTSVSTSAPVGTG